MAAVEGQWVSRARASAQLWAAIGFAAGVGLANRLGWFATLVGCAALFGGGWVHSVRNKRKLSLHATREGVFGGSRLLMRRDAMRTCSIEPQANDVLVRFEGRRARHDGAALVASVEAAERLVAPLELPVRRSVQTLGHVGLPSGPFPAAALGGVLVATAVVVWAALAHIETAATVGLVALIALWIAALWLVRDRSIELMADGIRVGGRGVLGRFVPYTTITSMGAAGRRLTLAVADGSPAVRLRFPRVDDVAPARAALEARIDAAVRVSAEADRAFHGLKDDPDLLACVRALADGRTDAYRAVAARSEDLARAITSPKMSRVLRVASAYVLARRDDVSRTELRRIATETGDPAVEGALLRIADGAEPEALVEEMRLHRGASRE